MLSFKFNFKSFAIKTNFFVGKQSQRQICTNTYHIHPLTHIYTYSLTHYIYTFTHTHNHKRHTFTHIYTLQICGTLIHTYIYMLHT